MSPFGDLGKIRLDFRLSCEVFVYCSDTDEN